MRDRVDVHNMWNRMRRNFIKWWRIVYVPVNQLFTGRQNEPQQPVQAQQMQQQSAPEQQPVQAQQQSVQNQQPVQAQQMHVSESAQTTEPVRPDENLLQGELSEEERMAKEILERLQREAEEDEAKKQAEIEAARLHAERKADATYNATTKSFSGQYGKGPMDDETKEKVQHILEQNGNNLF